MSVNLDQAGFGLDFPPACIERNDIKRELICSMIQLMGRDPVFASKQDWFFALAYLMYEPCGLSPIYAMRYGTLPIVRRSGGMADSVVDADQKTVMCGTATGFSFNQATVHDLIECVQRARSLYRQPIAWRKIRSSAMRQDFGWSRSAQAYTDLYRALVAAPTKVGMDEEPQRAKLIA